MSLSIIILAAGKGRRMQSSQPKSLQVIGGKPILEHIYHTARALTDDISIVYGHGGEQVKQAFSLFDVNWVEQKELLGTGHAVLQALPFISEHNQVLVLMGDCPLITLRTLQQLL